ncbi:MAG TPA: ester cyclase, partial [Anaerolineae bacterium]|nr:ester cyclase [Anaerolineae bacterium]
DGDIAILEFNETGTQTGRFLDYEPTGNKIDIDSCLVFRVRNGKITNHTTYLDTATILRSLGLIEITGVRPEAA